MHTLNLLHTWAYTTDNDQILIHNDGPFNQPMKIAFETINSALVSDKALLLIMCGFGRVILQLSLRSRNVPLLKKRKLASSHLIASKRWVQLVRRLTVEVL